MARVGLIGAVAVALAATAQCAPVRADPFESYHPELVQSCVENAGWDRDAMRHCIGVGARPCIEVDGSATSSHVRCWSHEADTWLELMNVASADLSARQAARDPQRLASANGAWQAWADAECEYWAWEEGGGSGEQVDRVQCLARITADRAITLITAAR